MAFLDNLLDSLTGKAYSNVDPADRQAAKSAALLDMGRMFMLAGGSGSWQEANKYIASAMPSAAQSFRGGMEEARTIRSKEEEMSMRKKEHDQRSQLTEMEIEEKEARAKELEALVGASEERAIAMQEMAEEAVRKAVESGRISPETGGTYLKRHATYLDIAKKSPRNENLWNRADTFLTDVMTKAGAAEDLMWASDMQEQREAEALGMSVEEYKEFKKRGAMMGREALGLDIRGKKADVTLKEDAVGYMQGSESGFPEKDGMIFVNGRWQRKPNPVKDQAVEDMVDGLKGLADNERALQEMQAYASGSEIEKLGFSMRHMPTLTAFGIMPTGREGKDKIFYTREDIQKALGLIVNPALARAHAVDILNRVGGEPNEQSTDKPQSGPAVKKVDVPDKAARIAEARRRMPSLWNKTDDDVWNLILEQAAKAKAKIR